MNRIVQIINTQLGCCSRIRPKVNLTTKFQNGKSERGANNSDCEFDCGRGFLSNILTFSYFVA